MKLKSGIHLDVERRALLAGGAAVLVSNAAQALQAGGITIDFEAAGGSVRNSGDRAEGRLLR